MNQDQYNDLKTFIEVDTKFLSRHRLMDYSLLLVIEEVEGDLIQEKELVSKKTEDLNIATISNEESEKSNSLSNKNQIFVIVSDESINRETFD